MTTAPMCLPVVWSLYSKGLSGRAVLSTTLAALGINLAFKFAVPLLFGFSLSRAGEMALGVLGPAVILAGHEACRRFHKPATQSPMPQRSAIPDDGSAARNNRFSLKVIGVGAMLSGALVSALGIPALAVSRFPLGIGLLLLAAGLRLYFPNRRI